MTPAATKVRPAVKWHGGKAYLARRIIALLPPHRRYVEPFAGGLSVLLNKPRTAAEVASDLDAGLVHFYRVLGGRTAELLAALGGLAYTRETFERARSGRPTGDIDRAVKFLVVNRFSRGGLGNDFAWSERLRGGQPGDLNGWLTIVAELPRIAARLRGVEFHCREAGDVIRGHDGPETLFYLDPPYLHETRTARAIYHREMSAEEHQELLATVRECRGAVVLSGYANRPYDEALSGWERHTFDMPNHSGQGKTKQRRVEVVWVKPEGCP